MVVITIRFVYELGKGALKIDSKQITNISNNSSSPLRGNSPAGSSTTISNIE